jgi:hypothetical protein
MRAVGQLAHPATMTEAPKAGEYDGYRSLIDRFEDNTPALRRLASFMGLDVGGIRSPRIKQLGKQRLLTILRGKADVLKANDIRPRSGKGPDLALQQLHSRDESETTQFPRTVDEMWQRIGDEIEARSGGGRAEERLTAEERAELFLNAIETDRGRSAVEQGGKEIPVEEFWIGDKFSVQGKPFEITHIDPEGPVTFTEINLTGTLRFRTQTLPPGMRIRIDRNSYQRTESPAAPDGPFASRSVNGVWIRNSAQPNTAEDLKTIQEVERAATAAASDLGIAPPSLQIKQLPYGGGFAVNPTGGSFQIIYVDPARLRSQTGASLRLMLQEEMLHNLSALALAQSWVEAGRPGGTFYAWYRSTHQEIFRSMTPAEIKLIQGIYGPELQDPVHVAEEFVRILLQQQRGRITEADYPRVQAFLEQHAKEAAQRPAIRRLLEALQRFWARLTGRVAASKLARQQVARVNALLRTKAKAVATASRFSMPAAIHQAQRYFAANRTSGQPDFLQRLFGNESQPPTTGPGTQAPAPLTEPSVRASRRRCSRSYRTRRRTGRRKCLRRPARRAWASHS